MAETENAAVKVVNKKKTVAVPNKTTMNFAHHQSDINPKHLLIGILLIAVVFGAFLKFGVLDQIQKKTDAYNTLSMKQSQLSQIQADLSDYDELADQYGRYSYGWMNESEMSLVNRMQILNLIESKIMPAAVVEDFSVSENILNLNVHGITLDLASRLVKDLESNPLVESATVYSASSQSAAEASIFMSVILTKEAAE